MNGQVGHLTKDALVDGRFCISDDETGSGVAQVDPLQVVFEIDR